MAGEDFLSQVLPAAQAYNGPPAGPGLVLPPGIGAPAPLPPVGPPPPDYSPTMGPIQGASLPVGPPPPVAGPPPPPAAPPPPQAAPPPPPVGAVTTSPAGAPMAGGVRVIPGHAVPAAELPQVGRTQEALWNQGQQKAEQAQVDLTEGRKTAALHDAMQASTDIDDARAREEAALQRQRDQRDALAARQQSIDSATKELGSMKVDPKHFWASKSTGQQIAGLLGVALGGFAQGFSGGSVPNVAWEMIRSQMDDDLKAQVANVENKRAVVNEQQRQFQNLVQQYGLDSAKDMWSAAQRERVAAQSRLTAASSAIPQIQAEGDAKAKEMQGEADKYRALAFTKFRPATATAAQVMVAGPTGEMIPIPVSPQEGFKTIVANQKGAVDLSGQVALKSMEEAGKSEKSRRDATKTIVTLPDGRKVDTGSESQKDKLVARIEAAQSIARIKDEALAIREKTFTPGAVLSPVETARNIGRLRVLDGQLTASLHSVLGTLSEGDKTLAAQMHGNLTSPSPAVNAALEQFSSSQQRALGDTLKTLPDYGTPSETVGQAASAPIKEYK